MYRKEVFNKIISLPEEDQRKLIKWRNFEEVPNFLKFTRKENEEIVTTIIELNLLQKKLSKEEFFQTIHHIEPPESFLNLFKENIACLDEYCIPCTYNWRVDLSVPKVNAVLINVNQFNTKAITFRLDIPTFHKLRFNVALVLNEIKEIKKKSKIKLK
ncbi:PREDICTED: uncharacterized protein LOC108565864 [Nicrophorus vespilloides]|uniref:Uncharacterized protein LOC108565864 n=1 Tax=Nicrophorus vespilloides TaxID=110193 RepID=A0ABM1N2G3_NICVS|nr:PREDICTED: uncharacterized protein LOC108565864 [Nicrophorus vespilloides]